MSSTAESCGNGNTYTASTLSCEGFVNSCVTVTRARNPDISAFTSVCFRGQNNPAPSLSTICSDPSPPTPRVSPPLAVPECVVAPPLGLPPKNECPPEIGRNPPPTIPALPVPAPPVPPEVPPEAIT